MAKKIIKNNYIITEISLNRNKWEFFIKIIIIIKLNLENKIIKL